MAVSGERSSSPALYRVVVVDIEARKALELNGQVPQWIVADDAYSAETAAAINLSLKADDVSGGKYVIKATSVAVL